MAKAPQQPQFEIPEAVRDMAEQSVEQARHAYQQFLEAANQAQGMMARSSDAMTQTALEAHRKTLTFAQQNMEASFDMAGKMAKASDPNEAMKIQQDFATKQLDRLSKQAQELSKMMAELAQRTQK